MIGEAQSLPAAAFSSATDLLVDAFFDNPAHVYIAPERESRAARLRWLLGCNLRVQTEIGESFCQLDRGLVRALGFWHRPGTPPVGIPTMLRHGLAFAPLRLGWGAFRRLLEITTRIEAQRAAEQPDGPSWYLNNMVVHEELRGTGVGSRLLGAGLRDLIDANGHAAVLATQRSENLVFYSRLGFEVASEAWVGEGVFRFRNWIMVRPPPA